MRLLYLHRDEEPEDDPIASAIAPRWRAPLSAPPSDTAELIVAGFSLAARAALKRPARGVLCLGFPFHPLRGLSSAGAPEQLRLEELERDEPVLVVQGERDPHGDWARIHKLALPSNVKLAWIPEGNHRFVPRQKSGRTLKQNLALVAERALEFLELLSEDG